MKRIAIVVFFIMALAACASTNNETLEKARYALDNGDWDSGVTNADSILNADPANVEAAILLSSAYAGRGGIRILAISADIADAGNSDEEFKVAHDALLTHIHESLVATTANLDDLRNSIVALSTTLDPQPSADNDLYKDQQYQLGILRVIEAFGLSSVSAQPVIDGTITATTITSDQNTLTVEDFVYSDDNLINSGMSEDDDLVKNVRKNYCVLRNASSGGSGFDLTALQDLNLCQLTPDADREAIDPSNFQSSSITECGDFDFDVCENAPNTEF